jgi:transmembrane sensor
MPEESSLSPDRSAREAQAAQWLAQRDRGLTAAEQDAYLQWMREDPRHAALIARHEATLRRMRLLADWQPTLGSEPNPDLFARPSGRRRWRAPAFAAAAAVLAGIVCWREAARSRPAEPEAKSYLRFNEQEILADGSRVELKDGSQLSVQFSPAERRVRLTGGEAIFTVTKNPQRPFVVEAGQIAVRAVGTAFDVRLDSATVNVLVTEGKVRLEGSPGAGPNVTAEPAVAAGQRAIVSRAPSAPRPQVTDLTPPEIRKALAWQTPRLQFFETPLGEAVAEFNRHNRRQLVLGEPGLETEPIGGTFRIDNLDGFVRLIEITLPVRSERRPNGDIVLLRAR